MKKTLSVCMVLFNRWEVSKQCLSSINETVSDDWQIKWSLIDNGSSDETADKLEDFMQTLGGDIEYLELLDKSIPQTQAVNRTINAASGEYMIRTDNDIQFVPGWLEDCLSIIRDPKFKNVGFVCPTHHLKDGNPNHHSPSVISGSIEPVKIDMVSRIPLTVPGNIFGLTSVIKDIGGFYTPYNLLHADVHYCMIARHMGYDFGYTWNTHCPHVGLPDLKTEYSQRAVHERRSEEQRYSAIFKGDTEGKHPQEIEFAQMLSTMLKSKGPKLSWHKDINILIPSVGRRVELIKNFKNIFNIPRWKGSVYTCGCDEYMPAAHYADEHFIVKDIFDDNYVDDIIEICKKRNISYIFPVIDQDVRVLSLSKNRILRDGFAEVVAPDYEDAEMCFDKVKTVELFKELDIKHPETLEHTNQEKLSGTFIEKPICGFASKNIKELILNKNNYSCLPSNILQRKIEGKEYTVDCVSDRRFDIVSLVARERITTRGGEIQQGKIVNHLHLFHLLQKISSRVRLFGPWCAQYIIDENGIPWFIEINTRFGGGNPISHRAGQDQPLIALKVLERDFFGYHYRYLVEWGLTAMRFDDCIYRHLKTEVGEQDANGSKRLKG